MEEKDIKSDDQNSGVTMEAMTGNVIEIYYGRVKEIWELTTLDCIARRCSMSDGLRMYREKTDIAVPSTPSPKMSHGTR